MDSRLIFRPRSVSVTSQEGTQEGRPTGGWLSRVKRVGGRSREIRISIQRRDANTSPSASKGEVAQPTLTRKTSWPGCRAPVPQTDTGGPARKVPRRARELSSRNSANCPRNLGRRGASVG